MWASVVAMRGLSKGGSRALEHRTTVVVRGLNGSVSCGIFPGLGSNPVSCTDR